MLIKHILGLLKAQAGSVRVFDLDPVSNPVTVFIVATIAPWRSSRCSNGRGIEESSAFILSGCRATLKGPGQLGIACAPIPTRQYRKRAADSWST